CFKSWPSTVRRWSGLCRSVIFVYPLHEDVHLRDRYPHRPLYLEAHRSLQVVRHLGDPSAVLDDDIDIDGQLSGDLPDLHSPVHVLTPEQRRHALAQPPSRHSHHAVAPGCGVARDGSDNGREDLDAAPLAPSTKRADRGTVEVHS